MLQALLQRFGRPFPTLLRREEGQGLVEYALIILLVAIAVIAAVTALGGQIGNVFKSITNSL